MLQPGYTCSHAPGIDFRTRPARVSQPFTVCSAGDEWLRGRLSGYRHWAADHAGLLIITAEEAEHSPTDRSPARILGPMVGPGRYAARVDLYRVLATIADLYHRPRAGRSAVPDHRYLAERTRHQASTVA